ncbi:MAG: DUF3617 family protein [Betaproteobacteria bacterium]
MSFRRESIHRGAQHSSMGLAIVGMFVASVSAPNPAYGQGRDDLWEVTTKMEMPGMPMAMPPQTNRYCIAKGGKDEDYVPKRENCKVLESKRTGSKVTYKMVCTGKDAMTVAGETTFGANAYDGKMMMSGKADGQSFEMSQTYSGKRVGDCTAPAK